jgi:peptidoglycan/LPS O-acetylase OafA/YrhL
MEKIQHGHQRLFFLDWIRAISTVLIVLTHYNNPYLVSNPIFVNAPFGIYIGSLGVSQFLIISGAALMYSHQDEESLNLKNFFWKRFKSLYPMFWIAFIIANSILFLKKRCTYLRSISKVEYRVLLPGYRRVSCKCWITHVLYLG